MDIRHVGKKIAAMGTGYMMSPAAGKAGEEIGLDFLSFYALGRGGVLGDVDGKAVAGAFHFFNPELVAGTWDAAAEKVEPRRVAKHYAEGCAAWGRDTLAGIADLDTFTKLADRVVQAAEPTPSSGLFAGWREMPLPDDALGRTAVQLTLVLREHRGGAHVDAIKQVGLSPFEAVACNTPHMLQLFGWTDPAPDTSSLVDRCAEAEDLTDANVAPAYAVLDEGEQETFTRVVEAVATKLGI